GRGIVGFSRYNVPTTNDSENLFVAVEIKEGKTQEMEAALEKLFDGDSERERREFNGYTFWQVKPAEEIVRPEIDILIPQIPGSKPKAKQPEPEIEEESKPFFPKGVVTIAHNYLLLSNNVAYVEEVLTREQSDQSSLSDNADYIRITELFKSMELGQKPHFLQSFTRTADTTRAVYNVLRDGKMPQSQSVLGRILNALLTPPEMEEGVRPTKFDGSKMPEFETIKNYFGPSGVLGASEEDGWFIKGFTIKSVEAEDKAKVETEVEDEVETETETDIKAEDNAEVETEVLLEPEVEVEIDEVEVIVE
ncbi:MAG: hypothetical protein ACRC2T_16330, partial [Thermoguttaceae bacterium]